MILYLHVLDWSLPMSMTSKQVVWPAVAAFAGLCGLVLVGCTKHEIEIKPIEVKPIYIQLDIRIQQQVNESLKFVEEARGVEPTPVPSVAP